MTMAASIQPIPARLGAERLCFARCLPFCWMAALALTVAAVAASPAEAQDRREKNTNLMEEAQERLAEETNPAEKERLRRKIEYYRHSLGYRDYRGRKITWQVSYQKRLLKQLDDEIARMESMTKGGWGLASKSDDCKRAVRIMARNLLQRSDREDGQSERARYGLAGMLLVHNADLIDALLAELPKIEEARQARGATGDRGTVTLDRGRGAANSLTDMARRIADGRMQMGHGELGRLAGDLQRIRQALDYARTGGLPPLPPDPREAEKKTLAEIDRLRQRALRLGESQGEISGLLVQYLDQAKLGIPVERVRPLAQVLLDRTRTALETAESLGAGKIGSGQYRKRMLERLLGALKRLDNPDERQGGYGRIKQIERDDRVRRRIEALPLAESTRANLWLGMEWIDGQMSKPPDDKMRQEANRLRGPLQWLAWRVGDLYKAGEPSANTFKAPYRKGIKFFESALAAMSKELRQPKPDTHQKCQRLYGVIGDLNTVGDAGRALEALGRHMRPAASIRNVAQQAAGKLFDNNPDDDRKARQVLGAMRDAFGLLAEFYDTTLPRQALLEANRLTRGKHQAAFKKQAGRSDSLIKALVEKKDAEYKFLAGSLPLYRMTAEWIVFHGAARQGDADRLRAARHLTADPKLIEEMARPAAEQLGEMFARLPKTRPDRLGRLVWPVAGRERALRTAVLALLELRREKTVAPRLEIVIDDLRQTSRGDPGLDIRNRWLASWHLNQAVEAYARGYEKTGDHHLFYLMRQNPFLKILLSDDKERK
ncbi:MAG: hypothetical protein GWP05_05460 [Anaerolineaceae bacterium]|nr:hypothetical protein [Anaerolineaceae bacterium]